MDSLRRFAREVSYRVAFTGLAAWWLLCIASATGENSKRREREACGGRQ